jgi:hypothetical protein
MAYLILLPYDIGTALKTLKTVYPLSKVKIHRNWLFGPIKEIVVLSSVQKPGFVVMPATLAWPQPLLKIMNARNINYLTSHNLDLQELIGATDTVIDLPSDYSSPGYLLSLANDIGGILIEFDVKDELYTVDHEA